MPFTIDVPSQLEPGLVVTLSGGLSAQGRRSVATVVAGLMRDIGEGGPAAATCHGSRPPATTDSPRRGDAADSTDDARSRAAFEATMDAELEWFEGGERLRGLVDDHQLTALARMHAVAVAELSARHSQSWGDRTPLSATEAVAMEVATATGLAQGTVALRLELATGSPARTAFLRAQVRDGATPLWRACEIVRETRALDDEVADGIARAVLAPTRDGAGLPNALFPNDFAAPSSPPTTTRRHGAGRPVSASARTPRSSTTAPAASRSSTTQKRSRPQRTAPMPPPVQRARRATRGRTTSYALTSSPARPSTAGPTTTASRARLPSRQAASSSSCRSRPRSVSTTPRARFLATAGSARTRRGR